MAGSNKEVSNAQQNSDGTTSKWTEGSGKGLHIEIIELDTKNFITTPDIYGNHFL